MQRLEATLRAAAPSLRESYSAYRTAYDLAKHYRDEIVPLRKQISEQQLESTITQTALVPGALAQTALNAYYERREVQLTRFNTSDYTAKVNPTEAEIEDYYKANPNQFQAPEMASVEYVVLDLDTVKKTIALNEADVKTYYEQNAARLSGKEERRASHILISAAKDAPEADKQKAKARATELLEQLRKSPGSFAELATKNSQDPGSAAKGGDLDYFGRGAMVKPFEDAAFALQKDQISDVVESDFGYHIIKVTDIKAPKIKSFEEGLLRHAIHIEDDAVNRVHNVSQILCNTQRITHRHIGNASETTRCRNFAGKPLGVSTSTATGSSCESSS